MLIPQRREDPCGGKLDRPFRMALVLGMFHASRNNSRSVVFCQLLITAVQYRLVTRILGHAGLEVVRDEQTSDAAEILLGVDMAFQPVLQLHVSGDLCISVAAARQNGYEHVRRCDLTGYGIVNG